MSYFKDTVRGIAWIGSFRVVTRVVAFGKTILLARLLTPGQFGIFGVAALTLSFLEVMTETGINTVLVQLKGESDDYIDSAWVVSIGRGICIGILMALSAGLISSFFHVPEGAHLIFLAAAIPIVRGFINPSEVNFQKHLLFKTEFFFRTAIFLVDAGVSVTLTLITKSPESLVWGILAGAITEMILSHLILQPHPKFVVNTERTRFVLRRGKWMTATGILDYFIQNGDNMVVGRLLGADALGLYQVAYQVSTSPVTEISNVLSKVTFPILVKMSHEKDKMKVAYLKTASIIAVLVGAITIVLIVFGNTFVSIVLGDKWLSVVPTLQILALFTFVKSIVLSSYALLLAHGHQERVTFVSVTGFAVMFASIIPLVLRFGIEGAALAALLGSLASLPPVVYYIRKS